MRRWAAHLAAHDRCSHSSEADCLSRRDFFRTAAFVEHRCGLSLVTEVEMVPFEDDVLRLVAALRELGEPGSLPSIGRASAGTDHMGAKLADAVLQAGVHYESWVRPRVLRIEATYPGAATTSGFVHVLRSSGAAEVLGLSRGRKLGTIVALAECLASQAVETPPDLRHWLQHAPNAATLKSLHGVAPKTINFLKLLVGLDAIAVDVQILKFVHSAGIRATDVEEVEARLMEAGRRLGFRGADVDALVWRSMAARA